MKVKVAKKKAKESLSKLQPILEAESEQVESAINSCTTIIQGLTNRLLSQAHQEDKDTLQSFIIHGISVVLIKQNQKGEETK